MSEQIETRLRAALEEYTEAVHPDPDGWERIEQRIESRGRPPSRRAVLLGAIAVVLMIALTVVVFARARHDSPAALPRFSGPAEIVTHVDGGLAVIDAKSGRVIRVLVPLADESGIASHPDVTPDGKTVYFSRQAGQCDAAGGPVIVSASTAGGPIRRFATGTIPAISPNGKYVAIVGPGIADPCGRTARLTVLDRATGAGVLDRPTVFSSIALVGWTPDSRHVRYFGLRSDGSVDRPLMSQVGIDDSDPAITPEHLAVPVGSLTVSLGPSGEVAVVQNDARLQGFRIVAADPERGSTLRTLISDRTRHVITLDADPSGRHLLYWTGSNSGPYELWRWTEGEKPVLIRRQQPGTGVEPEAVWVP